MYCTDDHDHSKYKCIPAPTGEHRCCTHAIEGNAVLEWVQAVLDGEDVSDFAESFPLVRKVLDWRRTFELIAEDDKLVTESDGAFGLQAFRRAQAHAKWALVREA
jgi:hypothetical protein